LSLTKSRYWPTAAIAVVAALAVGGLGGALTDLGAWYDALIQPAWKPPDWAFGPAWTSIFLLCAAAGTVSWLAAAHAGQRRTIAVAFALNALLNLLWSVLFFQAQRPDWSLIEVAILWLSVLSLIVICGRVSKLAAALLLPYLAWVAFASTINYGVVQLNGPFGA